MSYLDDPETVRQHRPARDASWRGWWCVCRHWPVIGRHQEDMSGLAVQRDGARTGQGGERLLHREVGGPVLLDHSQMAISRGCQYLLGGGIEQDTVILHPDRESGENRAGIRL